MSIRGVVEVQYYSKKLPSIAGIDGSEGVMEILRQAQDDREMPERFLVKPGMTVRSVPFQQKIDNPLNVQRDNRSAAVLGKMEEIIGSLLEKRKGICKLRWEKSTQDVGGILVLILEGDKSILYLEPVL